MEFVKAWNLSNHSKEAYRGLAKITSNQKKY